MNAIEKARAYVRNHDKQNDYERLTWGDVYNAYIQGSKDAYIKSIHEQHFKTSECMPPTEPGKKHNTIWVLSAGELVYYDYNEEMWYTENGMPTHVEIWTWPQALVVEADTEEDEPEVKKAWEEITNMFKDGVSDFEESVALDNRVSELESSLMQREWEKEMIENRYFEYKSAVQTIENAAERWHLGRDEDQDLIDTVNAELKKLGLLSHFNK